MLFSERYGFKPVRQLLQMESMDEPLRNGLWNCYKLCIDPELIYQHTQYIEEALWLDFYKKRIDDPALKKISSYIVHWFLNVAKWYEVYDFLEFWYSERFEELDWKNFAEVCNRILEREMSAYRFIEGKITPITSEIEISAIEQATQNPEGRWSTVTQHLRTSLAMFSDRQLPDYRNSVKEAISAVESACQIITGNTKATLGDTLKTLEQKSQLHKALKEGFNKLYGYTSDAGGIRHALTDDAHTVTFEEAKFMLVTCSAFVNYLRPHMTS